MVTAVVFVGLISFLAGADDSTSATDVSVNMIAVKATKVGSAAKTYDAGLDEVRDTLADLEYDTFRKVKITKAQGPYNQEFELPVNDRYTLYVTPLSKEASGRIRVSTRIEDKKQETASKNPINALQATSSLVPGDKLCLGGPHLDDGKLVIVLTVAEAEKKPQAKMK